jgi:anti-sigma regulatory factor (Ser/Thr protein kinase)
MRQTDFRHEVLFYDDSDEFLAGTVPYLREAIETGDTALVAVGPARTAALQGELGADADAVRFADMHSLGRNPARIIPFWRDFLDEDANGGRSLRGIGEPIWPGRNPHELDECHRHESLLNVAFDDAPRFSLLCPYDTQNLPDDQLEAAARCHPFASGSGPRNIEKAESGSPAEIFAGALPPRPTDAATLRFGRKELSQVRALVQREAAHVGLKPEHASDLVTAASELAANSIAHGGGRGSVWVWRDDSELAVEVDDGGLIEEPLVGRRRPPIAQEGGRGLWIANLLCDLVQIRSGDEGTAVRLRMNLKR